MKTEKIKEGIKARGTKQCQSQHQDRIKPEGTKSKMMFEGKCVASGGPRHYHRA